MTNSKPTETGPLDLRDDDLDDAQGSGGLLLPAVQAARDTTPFESAVLDFALTGDDNFSDAKRRLKTRG